MKKRAILFVSILLLFIGLFCANAYAASPTVSYNSHIQNIGWQGYKTNGEVSGTTGRSLRMEALQVKISGISGGIQYRVHIKNEGWLSWVSNGSIAGTTGQGLRIEAVQIKLTGTVAEQYDVYYRVHTANLDWLGWAKNGSIAGTTGCGLQAEAIQIKLVKKNGSAPGTTNYSYVSVPSIQYKAHVADIGWQDYVKDGATAGTTGQAKRIEALYISLTDLLGGSGVQYRAHIQDTGWSGWVTSNKMVGTTGQSRRIEAVQIQLSGHCSAIFDIYYRAHVSNKGWLGWAKNGEKAGTEGGSLAMEAIQIKIVLKGNAFDRGGTAFHDLNNNNSGNGQKSSDLRFPIRGSIAKSSTCKTNGQYCDYVAASGTPIYAPCDGTVQFRQSFATSYSKLCSYGNSIYFTSSDGKTTVLCAHLSSFNNVPLTYTQSLAYPCGSSKYTTKTITLGTRTVKQGDLLGYTGQTGNASGPHIHIEVKINGTAMNPASVFKTW